MKKLLLVFMLSLVLVGCSSQQADVKYETHMFVITHKSDDGMLLGQPFEPGVDGGYAFDAGTYQLGDIVSCTYWNDDVKREYKLKGEELRRVEVQYGAEINALLEESIRKYGMME